MSSRLLILAHVIRGPMACAMRTNTAAPGRNAAVGAAEAAEAAAGAAAGFRTVGGFFLAAAVAPTPTSFSTCASVGVRFCRVLRRGLVPAALVGLLAPTAAGVAPASLAAAAAAPAAATAAGRDDHFPTQT
jgi:hypothetical protein